MKRTAAELLTESVISDSGESPRAVAELVRGHAMQIRACTPGLSEEQVLRDAALLTSLTLGRQAAEVENTIQEWADDTAGSGVATGYDQSLAWWLKGDCDRAVELAVEEAAGAAGHARIAAAFAAQTAAVCAKSHN